MYQQQNTIIRQKIGSETSNLAWRRNESGKWLAWQSQLASLIWNFSQVILMYTISMSHNKSYSQSQNLILGLESELVFFGAGVKVGVGVPQKLRTKYLCRLVPKSATLSDLERQLSYLAELDDFASRLRQSGRS